MSAGSSRSVDLQAELELPQPRHGPAGSSVRSRSLLPATLEVADRHAGPLELGRRTVALVGVAAGPRSPRRSCVVVCIQELGRVEAEVSGALGTQLVPERVHGRRVGEPVLPGEVAVMLVEGVVVGGLGVRA